MIKITPHALSQLNLIRTNDYTVQSKYLRISIHGKECDGFVYACGFDHAKPGDKQFSFEEIEIVIDPFAAFYLKNFIIDYKTNYEDNEEGFIVENLDQEKFHGKFWKDYPELAPRL